MLMTGGLLKKLIGASGGPRHCHVHGAMMLRGAVWPRLPDNQLTADPHAMMMAPFGTAALVTVTAIMVATIMAPVMAAVVVAVLVTAVITVTVVALRIRASARTERCCQQASCSNDLGELHVSSSRARRSGMGWLYAASSASFLNGIVGGMWM